jgi:ADP-heptose:LPS heptosyltransferase
MRHGKRARNAAGVFSLRELPAFFERAALLVSVDTGPMHIAAFSGAWWSATSPGLIRARPASSCSASEHTASLQRVPIIALFLPLLAPRHHPYGQADGVVTPRDASGASVADIVVEDVIAAIERKLAPDA